MLSRLSKSCFVTIIYLLVVNSDVAADSSSETFTFEPTGTARLDYLSVDNNKRKVKNRFFFRDAIIGGEGKIFKYFGYKVGLNFSNEVRDRISTAYIDYKGFKPVAIRVGRFSPNVFLNYDKSFNEWPASGALVNQLKDGIQFKFKGDNWSVTTSYGTSEETSKTQSKNRRDAYYIQGTYCPFYDKEKAEFSHIGLSNSHIRPRDTYMQFKVKPEARADLNLLKTSQLAHINYGNVANLSLAYSKKSFSTQFEYLGASFNRDAGYKNMFFHGGYAQVAYFLTGESKTYVPSKGKIESIKPIDPVFEFGKSNKRYGLGAWEVAAKYSTVNLNSKEKFGKMDLFGLGLNWYLNDVVKLSNDFLYAKTDKNALIPNSHSKIALMRLEIDF